MTMPAIAPGDSWLVEPPVAEGDEALMLVEVGLLVGERVGEVWCIRQQIDRY